MNLVKMGVVGTGKMGSYHCFKLNQMKNVNFVGVYDKDLQKAEELGKKLNVRAFENYQDLLESVDAVVIAAPTKFHFQLVEEAIHYNKHILVEKPLTTSMVEANKIQDLLRCKDLIFQIGHIERFNPAIQQLGNYIESDKIISIEAKRTALSNRIQDSDVVLDVMIHDIDIILSLIKSPIDRISAEGVCVTRKGQYDSVTALLSFNNGVLATIMASNVSHEKVRSLTILEKDKVIKTDYLTKQQKIVENGAMALNSPIGTEAVISLLATSIADPLLEELEHFINCISFNHQPIIGIEEGTAAVEVAIKIKNLLDEKNK